MREETARELIAAIKELSALLKHSPQTQTSAAVDVLLSIVPLAGIVFGVTILFFFLLWRYRITRELIRTNQYASSSRKDFRAFVLLIGCLSTAVGLPLTILFYAVVNQASYVLLGGLIPLSAGIGLLVFFALSRSQE